MDKDAFEDVSGSEVRRSTRGVKASNDIVIGVMDKASEELGATPWRTKRVASAISRSEKTWSKWMPKRMVS